MVDCDAQRFRNHHGFDALLLPGILARERLGASTPQGRSEVIEGRELPGHAHRIVTTPVFPGHLEWINGAPVGLAHDKFEKETESFRRYREVFRAITDHNRTNPAAAIRSLGIHLEMIGAAEESNPAAEAKDFLRACRASAVRWDPH